MNNYKEIGVFLKNIREERSLSTSNVADFLKIRKKYIESIEVGDNSEIPGKAYLDGYIKMYAEYLGVSEEIAKLSNILPPKRKKFTTTKKHINDNGIMLSIFSILILILVLLICYRNFNSSSTSKVMEQLINQD